MEMRIGSVAKTILAVVFFALSIASVPAQFGKVYFNNTSSPAPIMDGVTSLPASGPNYRVALYSGTDPYTLSFGPAGLVSSNLVSGYFNGGLVSLPPYPPFTGVYLELRAWYPATYSSYEMAVSSGDPAARVGTSGVIFRTLGSSAGDTQIYPEFAPFVLWPAMSGSLQVTIKPSAAVSAGAQWRVDGGAWNSSGTTIHGVSPGSHTVSFSTLSGWTSPSNQTINIVAGGAASLIATYTSLAQTGSLMVSLAPPEAVTAGAQWRVDGGVWRNSGTTAVDVPVGIRVVSFSSVTNWIAPADQTVTVVDGETTTTNASYVYTPPSGSLQVGISPAGAVSAGAQWRLDGGAWQEGGVTLTNVIEGSHTVSFSAASGWIPPASHDTYVFTGGSNVLQGDYQPAGPLVATFNAITDVPVTASSYSAEGNTVNITLNFTPTTGADLVVVNNTGLGFINGTFDNLTNGQSVSLEYGGAVYDFVANYFGGSGNDLVLMWSSNRPYAWGSNNYGQLGDNSIGINRLVPVRVTTSGILAGKTLVSCALGSSFGLALCSDGDVAAWGANFSGQLGNNSTNDSLVPVPINTSAGVSALHGKRVVAVAAGSNHALALSSDGTVTAWGDNYSGQLGNNSTNDSLVPIPVNTSAGVSALHGKRVVAIAAGSSHSLALCSDGTLAAWGANSSGQLGNNSTPPRSVPVAVNIAEGLSALYGKTVATIAAGYAHNLALCSDGSLAAWGSADWGQLGDGSTYGQKRVPVAVNTSQGQSALNGKSVVAISAATSHSLSLCSDGTVAAWGGNYSGQLGDNSTTTRYKPVAVNTTTGLSALNGKTPVKITAGGQHSLAQCSDGTVVAWGANFSGQLGNNSTVTSPVPVPVNTSPFVPGERFIRVYGGEYSFSTLALAAMPAKVLATVTLSNLSQAFDGMAKPVSVTTVPTGLAVSVTYNGSPNSPTNVGNYTVIGTITDSGYQGAVTNTLTIFISDISTNVTAAQSATLAPGQTGTASTAPTSTGEAGLSVTATNGGGSTLLVAVANYDGSPTNVAAFQMGASYMDIRVWGADANDSLSAHFYYPSTITGAEENNLVLDYWNGANWNAVLSSGVMPPVKNTTDNLGGTLSGGRFAVVFDSTSTPPLTGLTGTVFALVPALVMPTPPQVSVFPHQSDGAFRLGFTNTPGAVFSVCYTTNLSVPFSNWTVLNTITESPPGHFQFTDLQATNGGQRFYRIRSP